MSARFRSAGPSTNWTHATVPPVHIRLRPGRSFRSHRVATADLLGRWQLQVVSDQPGTERYERVNRVTSGFGGERIYTFPGGCVVYTFDLRGQSHAEPVTEISNALGFVNRTDLATQVSEHSDGRLSLDPTE